VGRTAVGFGVAAINRVGVDVDVCMGRSAAVGADVTIAKVAVKVGDDVAMGCGGSQAINIRPVNIKNPSWVIFILLDLRVTFAVYLEYTAEA
jgi:hypothetical protein